MKKIVVAIDGFSSCGKSTMAKELARDTGYTYVDTGAMYRAVALYGIRAGIVTDKTIDEDSLKKAMAEINVTFALQPDGTQHTMLNGEDVEHLIRTLNVANGASRVSAIGFVRKALVEQQQAMGRRKGIVMDGRDIGTVVFPDAELKVFVTATAEVRARRRFLELKAKGEEEPFEQVLANIIERDSRDTNRAESPLRQADDACVLDNSNLTRDEQYSLLRTWFDAVVNE
ncbi:MAG: (d)CMP kinase [Candidatus Aphodosoma sp.]